MSVLRANRRIKFYTPIFDGSSLKIDKNELKDVNAVILSLPFGKLVDLEDTNAITDMDVPILIDAAAGLGNALKLSKEKEQKICEKYSYDIVFSLHATKAISAGEGGVLVLRDENWFDFRLLTNFGIHEFQVRRLGTNSKLAEINCASFLANLDAIERNIEFFSNRRFPILSKLNALNLVSLETENELTNSHNIIVPSVELRKEIIKLFDSHSVETRNWWLGNLQNHEFFADNKDVIFSNLNHPAFHENYIGIPFGLGIDDESIDFVVEILEKI